MQDNTTYINKVSQYDPPEPFMTVMELASQYGQIAVLEALNVLADLEAQDQDVYPACREKWLSFELSHLLERYAAEFLLPEPLVNHRGTALVQ